MENPTNHSSTNGAEQFEEQRFLELEELYADAPLLAEDIIEIAEGGDSVQWDLYAERNINPFEVMIDNCFDWGLETDSRNWY